MKRTMIILISNCEGKKYLVALDNLETSLVTQLAAASDIELQSFLSAYTTGLEDYVVCFLFSDDSQEAKENFVDCMFQ